MAYKRFSLVLAVRLVLLGVLIGVLVWTARTPGYHSMTLLVGALTVLAAAELWWTVSRTNRELARFLNAARHADFAQRFDFEGIGAGFGELGRELSDILSRLQAARTDQELEVRRLRALIEHIPVPLLTLHADDAITLQNNAARRLFGAARVTRLSDLIPFGERFHDAVEVAVPGRRELVNFTVDEVDYHLTLASTEISAGGRRDRLISLQDIQTELDDSQTQAWQDLVRVLTHEIMNSITPVTSLAKTAESLVIDIAKRGGGNAELVADLEDLREAVGIVARRSDSLTEFVDSYRQMTRLAPPEKKRIDVAEMFGAVVTLARAEAPGSIAAIEVSVEPAGLTLYADRDLLEPVLLNLLRNAREATAGTEGAAIRLIARLNRRGNPVIEVSDNGPGVPSELATKIFVPFFTTKERGSGVGLALARQVMTAHGGFIRLVDSERRGATFALTF
jgi:nitrogen fixation/metabolism regulation signal transduction histidine kinase